MAKRPAWTSCSSSSSRFVAGLREERDQLDVSLGELQRSQFAARHPSHLLTDERAGIAVDLTQAKMQTDRAFRISVLRRQHLPADARSDTELFAQLAIEAHVVRFAKLALAARKFPVACQMRVGRTTGDEESSVALDDGREHDDQVRLSDHARG